MGLGYHRKTLDVTGNYIILVELLLFTTGILAKIPYLPSFARKESWPSIRESSERHHQ